MNEWEIVHVDGETRRPVKPWTRDEARAEAHILNAITLVERKRLDCYRAGEAPWLARPVGSTRRPVGWRVRFTWRCGTVFRVDFVRWDAAAAFWMQKRLEGEDARLVRRVVP